MRAAAEAKTGWLVYLLACADGTLYCGITNDLERRLRAHGRGRVKYTRGRLPVAVAHCEPAADKSAALRAEAAWKRLSRRKKLLRIADAEGDVRRRTCVLSSETVSEDDAKDARRRRHHRSRGAGRRRV